MDHLKESKTYSDNDTIPIRKRLEEIQNIVENESQNDFPEVIQLIKQKLKICFATLNELEDAMKSLSDPKLSEILRSLVTIRREILSIGSKPKFDPKALEPVKEKLQAIEDGRDKDGSFISSKGEPAEEEAQNVLNGLLDECHNLISDFSATSKSAIPKALVPLYDQLIEMKSKLESLLVTHRWTLRETDLYTYQKQLDEIDAKRSQKEYMDAVKDDPKAQSIILYLLRRCYAILYKLLESSQPVSEALIPLHNQLSTVRRCLLEVQRNGGLSSVRELYPYQMKLASIDNLKVDGKFMIGDSIPEGQGMLIALLSECFEICDELKMGVEEAENGSDEDKGVLFTEGASDREEEQIDGDDVDLDDLDELDEEEEEDDDSDGVSLQKIPSYKK